MFIKLGSENNIVTHLLLLMRHRPFLWIDKATGASTDGCRDLLLVLICSRTAGITSKQWGRNGVNGLLRNLRIMRLLFFLQRASHHILCRYWRQWLLTHTDVLSLSRSRARWYVLLVVLLILGWALYILLNAVQLILIHHTVLVVVVAGRRRVDVRILIGCVRWIDRASVLLLRWRRCSHCSRSADVRAVWHVVAGHSHYLVVMVVLLVLAHGVKLLGHLIASHWSLVVCRLIWRWRSRNLRYLRVDHSTSVLWWPLSALVYLISPIGLWTLVELLLLLLILSSVGGFLRNLLHVHARTVANEWRGAALKGHLCCVHHTCVHAAVGSAVLRGLWDLVLIGTAVALPTMSTSVARRCVALRSLISVPIVLIVIVILVTHLSSSHLTSTMGSWRGRNHLGRLVLRKARLLCRPLRRGLPLVMSIWTGLAILRAVLALSACWRICLHNLLNRLILITHPILRIRPTYRISLRSSPCARPRTKTSGNGSIVVLVLRILLPLLT